MLFGFVLSTLQRHALLANAPLRRRWVHVSVASWAAGGLLAWLSSNLVYFLISGGSAVGLTVQPMIEGSEAGMVGAFLSMVVGLVITVVFSAAMSIGLMRWRILAETV